MELNTHDSNNDAIDTVDAMIYGETLVNQDNLDIFKKTLERWLGECDAKQELINEINA